MSLDPNTTFARCSKIKNVLYRDQSVDFLTQYVNVILTQNKDDLTDLQSLTKVVYGEKILVCGTAGAGKTMFLKWAALELIKNISIYGRIPLYLEMRYLEEDFVNGAIEDYIFSQTSAIRDASSLSQFKKGLESGVFTIILDAIDEVKPSIREKSVNKILAFLQKYPFCGVLISSRHDQKLESIQEFNVLRTKKMNKSQVIDVITKLDYDESVKERLIYKLKNGLYEELKEFLSNPLLITIMLLSFDHSADIPTKLTSFYHQAFEALYHRHDAAKGAYKRDHYAALPVDRFQSIFSCFSFQTYLSYKFKFSESELIEFFRASCNYINESVDPNLIIRDAMECVCLLQRDGLDIIFSHRSFQDYFCALFIAKYREEDVEKLVDAVASMESRSNVLRMLYEMDVELFEYNWVLPLLDSYIEKTGRLRVDSVSGLTKIFSITFSEINVDVNNSKVYSVTIGRPRKPAADRVAAGWMIAIMNASNSDVVLHHDIFKDPIWEDLNSLIGKIQNENPEKYNKIVSRINKSDRNEKITTIVIEPRDCEWLLKSNLPNIFNKIRDNVKLYRNEILKRREIRRINIRTILGRKT